MALTAEKVKPTIFLSAKPLIAIEESWVRLAKNIRQILHHNEMPTGTFAECYYLGYELVENGQAQMLYNGVSNLFVENLNRLTKGIVFPTSKARLESSPVQRGREDEVLLSTVYNIWNDHRDCVDKVGLILKYMDDVYVKPANLLGVADLGRDLFIKHVIRSPTRDHVNNAILSLLCLERDGHVINGSIITNCVDTLLRLSDSSDGMTAYKQHLEPEFLRQSEAYYKAEVGKLLETCNVLQYLRRVQTRLIEEELRVRRHLCFQTWARLKAILENLFLIPEVQALPDVASSSLKAMIDDDKLDNLSSLFRVYSLVPEALLSLGRSLKSSIQQRGTDLNIANMEGRDVRDSECSEGDGVSPSAQGKAKMRLPNASIPRALRWVDDVLRLKDKFDCIWKVSLNSDCMIERGLNEAFQSFINLHPQASEFISLYLDENLKNGFKEKTDAEIELTLNKAFTLFRFLAEKDIFERYYRAHLAKRLLHNQSVSDDMERDVLAKLKVECGSQFTVKLEGMFNDIKSSADTMQAYRDHSTKITAPEVDINITVMTSTFWPMSLVPVPCAFPPLLAKASKSFEQFYLSRHSGRKLTWQPSFGNADVRVAFKARKYDLNVSSLALVILLLFEDLGEGESLTYDKVKSATKIPDSELRRNLQSLACRKFMVLRKHPSGREVNNGDSFSFNADFSSQSQKIKINAVAARFDNGEERKGTQGRVEEERRYQTDVCIVRIMKDRNHMTHDDLVDEVTRQLAPRFSPKTMNIKQRIEALIEREYLEQCDDRKSYNYWA
ncbi:Cullin [Russula brevipes]|nr:Cullin [Russula brevipes]